MIVKKRACSSHYLIPIQFRALQKDPPCGGKLVTIREYFSNPIVSDLFQERFLRFCISG
jgi:hypothetical protein